MAGRPAGVMLLARFLRSLTRLRRVQPLIGRIHAAVVRRGKGRIKRSRLLAGGQPVLVLTSIGRRSAQRRSTVVAYLEHGDAYAVSAMNLGSDHHPAWYLNLRANPRAWIYVAGERRAVVAREATADEARELWRAFIERLPATANSLAVAQRRVPIVVLEARTD